MRVNFASKNLIFSFSFLKGFIQLSLILVYLSINLIGIPGAGSCGIWIVVEIFRDNLAGVVPLVLCLIGAVLWLMLLVLDLVIWVQLRTILAEFVRGTTSLDDAYRKFEEDSNDVAVFSIGEEDDDDAKTKSKKEKSEMREIEEIKVEAEGNVIVAEDKLSSKPPLPNTSPLRVI